MSLADVAYELTIVAGSIFLVLGLMGNGMNIIVFSSVRLYRRTPCTFYFLVGSIFNTLYILVNLIIRIISSIYRIDYSRNSSGWCKAQGFLIGLFGLTSFTCSCLAIIDQFLTTSRSVTLRQYSSIKWAYRIVFIVVLFWFLHGIPLLIFYDIPPVTNKCKSVNPIYAAYVTVYLLVLLCALPVTLMIIFGCLTYRNMRLNKALVRHNADRQLTRMTLIQVALVVVSMIPFGINNAYNLFTSGIPKTVDQQLKESFASTVFVLISYFYYIGNFYMFLLTSSRFRQTVKDRLCWWRGQNQIIPVHQAVL